MCLKVVSQSSCRDRPPANSCLLGVGEPPASSCLLPDRLLCGTALGSLFSERSLAKIFFIAVDSKINIHDVPLQSHSYKIPLDVSFSVILAGSCSSLESAITSSNTDLRSRSSSSLTFLLYCFTPGSLPDLTTRYRDDETSET